MRARHRRGGHRKSFLATVPAALVLSVTVFGSIALADYGGRVDSSPYGSQVGYTVRYFNGPGGHAGVTAQVRDVLADGYCAYVKISFDMPLMFDPATSKTVCGSGNVASLSFGEDRGLYISRIKIASCRILNGALSGCVTQYRTASTD